MEIEEKKKNLQYICQRGEEGKKKKKIWERDVVVNL